MAINRWPGVAEKLDLVAGWVRNGLTEAEIADRLDIALSTFRRYKDEHAELSEALKRSKELADIQVEEALLRRAVGYRYTEDTYSTVTDEETGAERQVLVKRVEKEQAPDTTSLIFWLKNRMPDGWKDKRGDGEGEDDREYGVALLPEVKEVE